MALPIIAPSTFNKCCLIFSIVLIPPLIFISSFLKSFIQTTKDAGSKKFVIHARKALLKKLSPKENLNIPPLKYEFVYQLKEHFNNDEIIINGGIKTTEDIKQHLLKVDGTMIGRAIYHSPYFLADI